jgi:hypothetical protein
MTHRIDEGGSIIVRSSSGDCFRDVFASLLDAIADFTVGDWPIRDRRI